MAQTLKRVERYDPFIMALGKMPLPPVEMVRKTLAPRDVGRFCRLWAIHVAADSHWQTPPGELFTRASVAEASRYVPAIPLYEASKSAAGGATMLTRFGFNGLMYGASEMARGAPPDPRRHAFTNDGLRGSGYRFLVNGSELLDLYEELVDKLASASLRRFFVDTAHAALNDAVAGIDRPLPEHHRLFARLTYARRERTGYLDISFGTTNGRIASQALFGHEEVGREPVKVNMIDSSTLVMVPAKEGWKMTGKGRVQVTSLHRANIELPDVRSTTRSIIFTPEAGQLITNLPPSVVRRVAQQS